MEVSLTSQCQNPELQAQMINTMGKITEAVYHTANERGLPAVVAGGACRDLFFGLAPNDVDIFVDISELDEGEAEDALLLFGLDVLSKMGISGEAAAFGKHLGSLNTFYKDTALSAIYQTNVLSFWWLKEEEENMDGDEEVPGFFEHSVGTKLQFIGKTDKTIAEPEKFVSSFDYGLVKTFFQYEEGNGFAIRTFSDFDKEFKAKRIEARDQETFNRADTFKWRLNDFDQWEVIPLFDTKKKQMGRKASKHYGLVPPPLLAEDIAELQRIFGDEIDNQAAANQVVAGAAGANQAARNDAARFRDFWFDQPRPVQILPDEPAQNEQD